MCFLRPIQWYHSHADPIWPDGTLKITVYFWIPVQDYIYTENRVAEPDPNWWALFWEAGYGSGSGSALERKAGSRSAFQSKFREFRGSKSTLTMEVRRLKLEPLRICRPVAADLHHFLQGAGSGSWSVKVRRGDQHFSENLDPDPHYKSDANPQPCQKSSNGFSFRKIFFILFSKYQTVKCLLAQRWCARGYLLYTDRYPGTENIPTL